MINRGMRSILALALLALTLTGCNHSHGEAYAWGDDWVVKDPASAGAFFDGLKNKLASEGFVLSGTQPSEGGQFYGFQGSYRGSPIFRITLWRSGPHHETFHLTYTWEITTLSPTNEDMQATTHSLHESLREWVEKGGMAYLPPGSK
jgi:hypothetical protein